MSLSEFDQALRLEATGAPGSYGAKVDPGWRIGHAVNGGLLLALAGRALAEELGGHPGADGHTDPFAISAYYLSPTMPGPVTVSTQAVRRGRSLSTGQVSIHQQADGHEVERLRALATLGDLAGLGTQVGTTAIPPNLPAPDECVRADQAPPDFLAHVSLLERLDLRLDPATVGWATGRPSGRGQIRGWLRMADGREPDPLLLLLAADALPPVAFDLGLSGWTPTLELTVHVRARPAPGWLRIALSTRNFAGGLLEEDAEVWDSAGRLVAQSRQLARAAMPSSGR